MTWNALGGMTLSGIFLIILFGPGDKWTTILCGIWIAACLTFGITAIMTHQIPMVSTQVSPMS